MRCQCVDCGIIYDLKEPFEDDSISHGCCEICWPWVKHNLEIELEQLESQNHLSGAPESTGRNQAKASSSQSEDGHGINPETVPNRTTHEGVRYPNGT